MAKHAAEAKGCSDAMMFDYRGYVAEATGANIFFVKNGEVHTPKPDCFLNGITRQPFYIAFQNVHWLLWHLALGAPLAFECCTPVTSE